MPRTDYSLIRHLNAPIDGPRIVGAEFESTVYVWDLKTRQQVSLFETHLDYGGKRLAINPRGDICAVAAYTRRGLVCYTADSGEVICVRDDLKKLQYVNYSPDGTRLYCGGDKGPLHVLDAETGADLAKFPATERAFGSPHQPIELLSKRTEGPVELRTVGGDKVATIARTTFAILDVAFGLDRLCMTESGGPVRCLDTEAGAELWRYTPDPGRHILDLTYNPNAAAFFGVEWPYQTGGARILLRFDASSGKTKRVATIKKRCAKQIFCQRGEALLTTEGELYDVATGVMEKAFEFPAYDDEE